MRAGACALAALLVGACAFTEWGAPPAAPPPRPNVTALTDRVKAIFASLQLPGAPLVSPVRPAHPLAMADWIMCLRSDAPNQRQAYALFVQNNQIDNYRRAVGVDQCERDTYVPLDKMSAQDWQWDVRR
jgi:hypothetical protein